MERAGTVVILAAGQGTRMRSPLPKVLYGLCGRPMLGYVLDQARALEPERILVVIGHGGEAVRSWLDAEEQDERITCVTQAEQKGTGHAVMVCAEELRNAPGPVVVLYGDMPLLTAESLAALCETRGEAPAAALTALPDRPRGFGRILRDNGVFQGIVEEKDATPEQLELPEVNVGVYCFDRETLLECLPRLTDENAQGEYYLTDVLAMVVAAGHEIASATLSDAQEGIGINTLEHLSEARGALQERILLGHMARGVFVEDPATTYVDHGVEIGTGTRILPCTVIRRGVKVGEDCEVGPFTHLRVGTVLEDGAEVGNFTEAKKATVGHGTKAKHLTYLGDVTIGAGVNIGAGTIVANYDGKNKHHTEIGDRAFVGSGSILIAPCTVGEGALTGAGAVVTRNTEIPAGDAWVGVPARSLKRKDESPARGGA
jgi:bifunctional UDP-N-acetylglucosamine pyrophosphorylase/glucosamine-1-phosphate N-acetyltransferase